ncbi:DUF4362 domain-containing protein [Paenibacillus spongiae]|uniref:DUF4362 domain-containing protein n=1 Tax=Paenibacillus spongiae TaxID=2909671 RepID=A0ABY5SG13_9BACL|nr:DUF4362 domain-containing protein [Paenibacillus spongiae]UVI32704.1 DUF4362 domain-containing protein [Paenibacillus spongiae]
MQLGWKALIVISLIGLLIGCETKAGNEVGGLEAIPSPDRNEVPSLKLSIGSKSVPKVTGGFEWTAKHGNTETTTKTDAEPVRSGLKKLDAAKADPGALLNIDFDYKPQRLNVYRWEGEGDVIQVPVEQDTVTLPSEAGVYMFKLKAEWEEGDLSFGTKIEIVESSSSSGNEVVSGGVIDIHGNVENVELLDSFLAGGLERLRITHYTKEGDPIYHDLTASQDGIELRYDTTEDKFGSPQVHTYSCGRLERAESDTALTYTMKNCSGKQKDIEVLQIDYDLSKQDYFAFALQYGVGERNVIDTIQGRLVKDLQNGEVTEVSDFKLKPDQMQAIYKQLKLSNFLGEKKLSTACNRKPHVSYSLQVKINGGSADFKWSECDESKHGNQMTKIAEEIAAMVASTDTYM